MTLADPIGDMITRIRNAQLRVLSNVEIPSSKFRVKILEVLKQEGYISDFKLSSDPKNKNNFISSGLWSISRHPNYLGEITLWLGISIMSISSLNGWQFITLISPVFTYVLLVYISGVRILEASGKKRWGHLESYQEYLKKTPSLIF